MGKYNISNSKIKNLSPPTTKTVQYIRGYCRIR